MISVIIQFLIAKFGTLPYISKVFGMGSFVEVDGEKIVAVYSDSELVHVNFDNYQSLVYILNNGSQTRTTSEHPFISNLEKVTEIYPFRAIIYSQGAENINCSSYSQSIAQGIKKNLSGLQEELREAINADTVTVRITDCDFDKVNVWKSQTTLPNSLKDSDILVSVDFEVSIIGDEQCFETDLCFDNTFDMKTIASLEISGTGGASYSHQFLINKTILLVATDGRIRKNSDFTFISSTGTITFISPIVTGQKIYILYK